MGVSGVVKSKCPGNWMLKQIAFQQRRDVANARLGARVPQQHALHEMQCNALRRESVIRQCRLALTRRGIGRDRYCQKN